MAPCCPGFLGAWMLKECTAGTEGENERDMFGS